MNIPGSWQYFDETERKPWQNPEAARMLSD